MDRQALVRRVSRADIDALVPLFDAYRQFYGQPSDPALAFKFLDARLSADESVVFLAEEDGGAVGFAQLYPSFSSLTAKRIFILNDLFVVEPARRVGTGRKLIDAAAKFARASGAAGMILSTAAGNRIAHAVYEAAGWKRDDAFFVYTLNLED
ncbi:MAG: acetyltransferase [Sphingomonas bacterium]|nr:GNAT family N-acetyltransferase [Sphingomonas bacterium]MDB5689647.1 acetyltransferase [Sphingomonas bacterium]